MMTIEFLEDFINIHLSWRRWYLVSMFPHLEIHCNHRHTPTHTLTTSENQQNIYPEHIPGGKGTFGAPARSFLFLLGGCSKATVKIDENAIQAWSFLNKVRVVRNSSVWGICHHKTGWSRIMKVFSCKISQGIAVLHVTMSPVNE